jgi:TRAP-type C4-dicarboxylate transport system permease large subunit
MIMTGMIYCLMAGANCFGKFFTLTLIPKTLGSFVAELGIPSIAVIAVLTLVYLVLGCFIDGVAMILLTTPIFLPVVEAAGFSSLWFGCYMVVIVGLGAVTPPVGMNCYIVAGVSGVPLNKVFRGSMPFVFAYVAMALLLALIPGIATFIPNALM